ncbi:MAG: ribosomal-processing cysteine protease Prp [Bacilli bacterium]|nr:ribosomal-processing cysteine protease Prp [Bacilli bacterium]
MIKVTVRSKNNAVECVLIKGHADYDDYGKDIVCAAVSTMAITTINAINSLDETLDFAEKSGLLEIRVKEVTDINQKLLSNLIIQLEELKSQYPKNIEIRNED